MSLLAWQGQQEIPPTDDPTHKNQPAFCLNYPDKYFKQNCDCKPKPGSEGCKQHDPEAENRSCKVYCRRDKCMCSEQCQTKMLDKKIHAE